MNCRACNDTATNCQKCINKAGIVLQGNSCKCNTWSGYFESTKANISTCLPCHPLAQNCTGPNFWESLSCNSTIPFLRPINGTTCQCLEGYYYIPVNVGFPGLDICGSNKIFTCYI